MKKILFSCCILVAAFATQAQTKKYEGQFFTANYPTKFKVTDCKKAGECNDATFTSPDKLVSFYVFAPQWNGEPDVALKSTEKENNRKISEVNGVTITEVTISAKNGSYTRSYYDAENKELNTRYCFEIKYKNMTSYNKYKAQYIAFKKSLEQFAD